MAEQRAREAQQATAEAARSEERAVAAAAAQRHAEGAAASARDECAALRDKLAAEQRAHRKLREQQEVQAQINLREMLGAKTVLDEVQDRRAFDDARNRANPFEGVRKEFFINRAAAKMAAIDAAFGWIFSYADAQAVTRLA